MGKLQIEYKPIDKVIPYDKNPRQNDDAVQYVAESIKAFGFINPILLDARGTIMAGHTRLKAAKQLGMKEVPVVYVDDLSEEQARAFRLADNKTAEFAEWDEGLLEQELAEILELDMSLDGYDEDSYERSRGVRKYRQVVENIKTYAKWRRENSPDTSLGVQFVADSVAGVLKFYEANRELDVDYYSFRPLESTGGSYYRDRQKKAQAREITAAIEALAAKDSRITLNFKWDLLETQGKSCTAQWAQIAVNECGEVMYCCHKPYQIVGHILDDDILEKKAQTHTDMSMCDIPCRMTAPNMFVAQTMKKRKDPYFI